MQSTTRSKEAWIVERESLLEQVSWPCSVWIMVQNTSIDLMKRTGWTEDTCLGDRMNPTSFFLPVYPSPGDAWLYCLEIYPNISLVLRVGTQSQSCQTPKNWTPAKSMIFPFTWRHQECNKDIASSNKCHSWQLQVNTANYCNCQKENKQKMTISSNNASSFGWLASGRQCIWGSLNYSLWHSQLFRAFIRKENTWRSSCSHLRFLSILRYTLL